MDGKQDRVFIGLREIAGYFGNLKKGFDEIGVDSAFLNLGGSKFNYDSGKNPKWVDKFNWIGQKLGARFSTNFILRFIWLSTLQNILGFFAFLLALPKYNVFILGGNSTFFFFLDYIILKLFRKKIICVYFGSDTRPIYLSGALGNMKTNLFLTRKLIWLQKKIVVFSEKKADFVINHPPTGLFHEKNFISWLHIGIPCLAPELIEKDLNISEKINIIHAPSKRGPKGSVYFEEIIQNLKEKYPIEYVEISGMPHKEVIHAISGADIALDQFFSDSPMATFATECAFQKVPVVIGGYYADFISNDYQPEMIPPTIYVHPDKVETEIEKLILDVNYRRLSGEKAYNFANIHWRREKVAKRYMQLISGVYPDNWLFQVKDINYCYGAGIEINSLKKRLKMFIDSNTSKYLYLEDKPKIKESILEFINEKV